MADEASLGISKVSASIVNNEPKPLLQQKMNIDVKEKTESVKHQTKDNGEDSEDDIPLSDRLKMNFVHDNNAVVVLSSGDSDDDDDTPLSAKLFRNSNSGTCSSNYALSVQKRPISKVQKEWRNANCTNNKQEKPSKLLVKRHLDKSNFLHSSVKKSMVSESTKVYKRQAKKSKRSSQGLEYSIPSAELYLKEKELALVQKSIEECQMKRQAEQQRLHTLEREIEECSKEIENKKKQVDSIQGQLSSMKKQFEGGMMELQSKEKQFEERLIGLRSKEEQLDGQVNELESIKEHLELWEKEIQSKEKQFDGRVKELESKEKQLEGQVNKLKSKQKQYEGRVKDLELKEKQFEVRVKELESKENKFEVQVKEFNAKKMQFEGQVKEVKFKEKQFEAQVKELKSKEKQFERQVKNLESKRNQFEGQLKELELKENQYQALVKSFEDQKVPDKQLSPTTDGRSLQLVSNVQTNETELLANDDVLVHLKTSSDPAKLVLDIIQNPVVPKCRKEGNAVIVNRYQIFLLEQLMRLSPHIEPNVRDEARKLALDFKANIRASTKSSLVVLRFLLLLSIYGLVSYFNEDEVLKLFEYVAQHKQAIELFQTLGFVDKVSDFVQSLIEKQQLIEAVGFICAYKLVEKYQPVDLLREHVQNARLIYESRCKKAKSIETKVKAIDQEIASLETVVQCISDNNIESQDLHKEIQDRIRLFGY